MLCEAFMLLLQLLPSLCAMGTYSQLVSSELVPMCQNHFASHCSAFEKCSHGLMPACFSYETVLPCGLLSCVCMQATQLRAIPVITTGVTVLAASKQVC